MTPPLSVLLPVHNVQATLASDVARLLDTLGELTAWFDLLVIDDGSTDATCEIAEELVTEFPQVRLIRHAIRRGVEASWRIGLGRTDAPIVVGHNGRPGVEPAVISSLLLKQGSGVRGQGSADEGDEEAESAALDGGRNSSRLVRWLSARSIGGSPPTAGGFCVLRREGELPAVRHPSRWRIEPSHFYQHAASQAAEPKPAEVPRPDRGAAPSAPRPSFLARLQKLALGE